MGTQKLEIIFSAADQPSQYGVGNNNIIKAETVFSLDDLDLLTDENETEYLISGKCSDNTTISLEGGIEGSTTCNDNTWKLTRNLSFVPTGTLKFEAISSNNATISASILKNIDDSSLIGSYSFSDPLNLGDDDGSSNENDAYNAKNISLVEDDERGSVIEFNGKNSYFQLNSGGDFFHDSFRERSYLFWFRPSDITTKQYLMDEGGAGNGAAIKIENGKVYAAVRDKNTYTTTLGLNLSEGEDKWYFLALIFQDGQLRLVLNDRSTHTNAFYTSVGAHSNSGGIGRNYGSTAFNEYDGNVYRFSGKIDDLKIYEIALGISNLEDFYGNDIEGGDPSIGDFIDRSLLAEYNFELNSSLNEDSEDTEASEVVNNLQTVNDSTRGTVIEFDGEDSSFQFNYGVYLRRNFSERTISMWVKSTDYQKSQILFDEGGGWNGMALKIESGKIIASTRDGGAEGEFTASLEITQENNEWIHVAAVFNNGLLSVYLNGQSNSTECSYTEVPWHGEGSGIGATTGGYDAFGGKGEANIFSGFMDDVHLYLRALSSDEIEYLYNN